MGDQINYNEILDSFLSENRSSAEMYSKKTVALAFPVLVPDTIHKICQDSKILFQNSPTMLEIDSNIVIVGDIHGQILDLLRILNKFGLPSQQKYLFLGDIVDRGQFSLECIIIVLLLKIIWPDNFYLIRGNHEFSDLCARSGFLNELRGVYPLVCEDIFKSFLCVFSYIPLAALIDGSILCIHGGLGPNVYSISQIKSLERPIEDFGDDIIDSLLWSDPTLSIDTFEQSSRGTGYLFGKSATCDFLSANNIKHIVRGHECVADAVERKFGGALYTVFSASNYCGLVGNKSGVLMVKDKDNLEPHLFNSLDWITRADVLFKHTRRVNKKPISKNSTLSDARSTIPRFKITEPFSRSRRSIIGSTPRYGGIPPKPIHIQKFRRHSTVQIKDELTALVP